MSQETPISRETLDAGGVDFSEIDTGERLTPVHPGGILLHEFMQPLGLTSHALSLALRVPANRIGAIVAGRRAVTADTALRLARYFGTSAGFWLNLQKSHDMAVAEQTSGARIRAEVLPRNYT
ncbi:MAG: HigA family addiction module antitoxin [Rhodospirillales bacterium]